MIGFVKREMTFSIAFVLTVLAMVFFPLGVGEYIEAIDFRILALLFSLMSVSAGLRRSGFFRDVSTLLLRKASDFRRLSLLLVTIVFFTSMLVTNDVALIVFVPFTLMILEGRAGENSLIYLVVMETIAANLGSMATPVGNPQNLFLYSYYGFSASSFFSIILPLVAVSYVLVAVSTVLLCSENANIAIPSSETKENMKESLLFFFLLFLALLSVFRVLDYRILLLIVVAALLVFDRKIFFDVDYILLLTFVCFFIFSTTMGRIPAVRDFLVVLMDENALVTSMLTSQVISNVPSAVLLAPFSTDGEALLVGTDIGGLGTPVASLASLISMKFFFARPSASKGRYMAVFLVLNFAFLLVLYLFHLLF